MSEHFNAILPEYNDNKTKCNNLKSLNIFVVAPSSKHSQNLKRRPCNVSVVVPASRKSLGVEGHWDRVDKDEPEESQNGDGELNCYRFENTNTKLEEIVVWRERENPSYQE